MGKQALLQMQPFFFDVADSKLLAAKALAVAGLIIFSVYYIDEAAKGGGAAGGFLPVASR